MSYIKFENVKDFSPEAVFDCGQCFRFDPVEAEGGGVTYDGVAFGKYVRLSQNLGKLTLYNTDEAEFEQIWKPFLGLDEDYGAIRGSLSGVGGEYLDSAMVTGQGIRILRQDPWEALCSFIISQNNNIGRIKSIVSRLSMAYGTPVEYDNTVFYLFPTMEQLKNVTENDYKSLGLGYRAGYLEKTVKDMLDGKIDLDALKAEDYFKAKEILLSLHGVGPKVADCILLFGLNHLEAFPVDTENIVLEFNHRISYSCPATYCS